MPAHACSELAIGRAKLQRVVELVRTGEQGAMNSSCGILWSALRPYVHNVVFVSARAWHAHIQTVRASPAPWPFIIPTHARFNEACMLCMLTLTIPRRYEKASIPALSQQHLKRSSHLADVVQWHRTPATAMPAGWPSLLLTGSGPELGRAMKLSVRLQIIFCKC